eukprot:2266026-Prymnesium_polylepis.1
MAHAGDEKWEMKSGNFLLLQRFLTSCENIGSLLHIHCPEVPCKHTKRLWSSGAAEKGSNG